MDFGDKAQDAKLCHGIHLKSTKGNIVKPILGSHDKLSTKQHNTKIVEINNKPKKRNIIL